MFRKNIAAMLCLGIPLFLVSCTKQDLSANQQKDHETRASMLKKKPVAPLTNNVKVFATGLNNPRGLEWGPDGYLYVAEGGLGGSNSTVGLCEQVPFPFGPHTGSPTSGRVSKISPSGARTTVTDQLPSAMSNPIIGGDIIGVADVAFVGNTLYALVTGGGCSNGVPSVPNGIVRINSNGTWTMIANLSEFIMTHPAANPEAGDFEPDGSWYSMVNVRGDLYVIEANQGRLIKVTTDGKISQVLDISAVEGHIVPTAMDYRGNFFVGNLGPFPIGNGTSKIMKINPSGAVKDWITGLNAVLGVVVDNANTYVLEMTVGAPFPTPGLGRVIRVAPNGTKTIIAEGLNLPTGMTMGPDGKLYVSNWGFGPMAIGGGQVLQIDI